LALSYDLARTTLNKISFGMLELKVYVFETFKAEYLQSKRLKHTPLRSKNDRIIPLFNSLLIFTVIIDFWLQFLTEKRLECLKQESRLLATGTPTQIVWYGTRCGWVGWGNVLPGGVRWGYFPHWYDGDDWRRRLKQDFYWLLWFFKLIINNEKITDRESFIYSDVA